MKREDSQSEDGSVTWHSHYGKQYGGSSRHKKTAMTWESNLELYTERF